MQVTINSTTVPDYKGTSPTATLKIYASPSFFNDGVEVVGSRPGSTNFYKSVACTILGGVVTIPSFTVESTTDSSDDGAKYTAILEDAYGTRIATLATGLDFSVPPVSPTSWTALVTYNQATIRRMPDTFLNANQISSLVSSKQDLLVSGANIKTINGDSLLGTGDLAMQDPLISGTTIKTVNSASLLGSGDIPVQTPLVSGTSIKTVNGNSLLGAGDLLVAGEKLLSTYSDFASAVSSIGTTKTILKVDVDDNIAVSTNIPSTLYLKPAGGLLTKTGTGALHFQGAGIDNPESQIPLFSGFAAGDVTWTGSTYPARLSTSLWADAKLDAKITRADAAVAGKTCELVAYPGDISAQFRVTSGHTLRLTAGDYTDSINVAMRVRIVLESNTRLVGDGMTRTTYNCSTAIRNGRIVAASGLMDFVSQGGPNENIEVCDIYFKTDISTPVYDDGGACVILGNCTNGHIKRCYFKYTCAYAAYVGGAPDLGYYALNCSVTECVFDGVRGQNTGSINGQNIIISDNIFTNIQPEPLVRTIASVSKTGGSDTVTAAAGTGGFTAADVGRRVRIMNGTAVLVDAQVGSITNTDNIVIGNYTTGATATAVSAKPMEVRVPGGNISVVDFEPNVPADTCENILIANNIFDGRNALQNWNAIVVQPGGNTAGCNNVQVIGNNIRGGGAHLSNGMLLSGSKVTAMDNLIESAVQSGLYISAVGHGYFKNNILRLCGGSAPSVKVDGVTDGFFDGNILDGWDYTGGLAFENDNDRFLETESTGTVNTSGTTVTRVTGVLYYPWMVGKTITINSVDYTVDSVTDAGHLVLTSSAGTQTGVTLSTKFHNNIYTNNKGRYTLVTNSRVISAADRSISDSYAPAQITATQNDYNPGRMAYRLDLSTNASRDITGLQWTGFPLYYAPINGERHLIYNAGSNDLVLKHENVGSTAAYRFHSSTAADVTVSAGQAADIEYSSTLSRWIVFKRGSGGVTPPLLLADGTKAAPTYSFSSDTDTGLYWRFSNLISMSVGGSNFFDFFNNAGVPYLRVGGAGGISFASGELDSTSPDVGLGRSAAGVAKINGGDNTSLGWLQSAGYKRVGSNVTNATATMSNITDLSISLQAGRKYSGEFTFIAKNSTAGEGLQFDFNGGSATFTSIEFGFKYTPPGATLGTVISSAAGTAITVTTATTGDLIYTVYFTCVCNAAGTLIPRVAEVSHASGTATLVAGSISKVDDYA